MTVAEYIFNYLYKHGTRYVFLVVGGGAMFLNDAIRKSGIQYIYFHHKQAASIAAEGYARISGNLGVVCVTTGCGGTNTITGVMGQWTDSVPVLYISGQVTQNTMALTGMRQLGDQEINIIDIVKPITKFAKVITRPDGIKHELQRAIEFATTERFGAVWLDIPLDVQSAHC